MACFNASGTLVPAGLVTLESPVCPAHMQGSFPVRNLFIPRAKVKHWLVEFREWRPYHPPVVGTTFNDSAIRPRTAIERISNTRLGPNHAHKMRLSHFALESITNLRELNAECRAKKVFISFLPVDTSSR